MRARAHDIIAIDACPLFAPGLAGAIAAARALAAAVRGVSKPLDIQATATLDGLDFDLRGSGALATDAAKLARTAERLDLARVSNPWRGRRSNAGRRASRSATRWRRRRPAASCRRPKRAKRRSPTVAAAALRGAKTGRGPLLRRRRLRAASGHGREVFAVDSDAAAVAAL